MTEFDLLVIGDVNPDLIVSGGNLEPRYGQVETLVERADLVAGGSASITAIGAARLGLRVGICGVVGDDAAGRLMRDCLSNAGVDTGHLRIDPVLPTGMSVIFTRRDDRAILTAPGTIRALSPDDLEAVSDMPARHVHAASYYLMSDSYRRALPGAFRRFREHGVTTSIDANWDPAEEWDLDAVFDDLDLFLPNRAEIRAVTRRGSIDEAMARIEAKGPAVAVKLGSKGAATLVDGEPVRVAAPSMADFVDAIGAGDSFNAGFLAARLSGAGPLDSLRLGVAAGTLSTRSAGGTSSQPKRDEADLLALTIQP